ncbi:hypothetical protein M5689_001268 [Euphorbia peplus]|nr:hypothetical protein M5689_001268 [Euphorbia peplus]
MASSSATSSFKNMAVILLVAALASASAVSAQEMAPSPAPSMDKGAAYSFGMSSAVICSSIFLSMLAIFKH